MLKGVNRPTMKAVKVSFVRNPSCHRREIPVVALATMNCCASGHNELLFLWPQGTAVPLAIMNCCSSGHNELLFLWAQAVSFIKPQRDDNTFLIQVYVYVTSYFTTPTKGCGAVAAAWWRHTMPQRYWPQQTLAAEGSK